MKANLLLAVLLMGCTVPPIPKPLDEAVSKLASTADRNKVQRIKLNESYLDYVIDRRLEDGADDDGKVSLEFVRAMLEISKRGHGLIREIDAAETRRIIGNAKNAGAIIEAYRDEAAKATAGALDDTDAIKRVVDDVTGAFVAREIAKRAAEEAKRVAEESEGD